MKRVPGGFTLLEAVVTIVVTGIIAGIVAVFIRSPIDAYISAERRASLTDEADLATRRMTRDLRASLPNSVRMPLSGNSDPSDQCLEFMPTKIGARYRAVVDGTNGNGNPLDFTVTDDSFDILWSNAALPAEVRVAVGDVVVVYNDGSTSGDAYSGVNAIQVAAVDEPGGTANTTKISFVGTSTATPFQRKRMPSESPWGRFLVVPSGQHVIAYRCNGGALTRSVRVLSGAWSQPADCAAMVANPLSISTLASHVGSCSIIYDRPGVSTGLSRFGIVSISLAISDSASGESVRLYQQVHVDNTP